MKCCLQLPLIVAAYIIITSHNMVSLIALCNVYASFLFTRREIPEKLRAHFSPR